MLLNQEYRPPLQLRLRARHIPAAGLAIAGSLLLHTGLIRYTPAVTLSRVYDEESSRAPIPTVLKDIQLHSDVKLDRPERFQPEHPDAAGGAVRDFDDYAKALATLMPQALPEAPLADLQGGLAAVEPVPELPDPVPFAPRQEIVRIQEALLADEVASLPRRYVSDLERLAVAPDITLPVDLALPDAQTALSAGIANPLGDSPTRGAVGLPSLGLGVPAPEPVAHATLQETASLVDEASEEISDIPPVEQLLLLGVSTYRGASDPHTYFRLSLERAGPEALPVLPRDVLLILDASHSMTQRKLDYFKTGLLRWLDSLAPQDRFNVMVFRDQVSWCFDDWVAATGPSKTRARIFIEELKARGRTDLFASLAPLSRIPRIEGRPVIAVLGTDGRPTMGMVDSSDIIVNLSRLNQGHVSVFALGGGTRVNRYLLEMLSFGNRGDSLIVEQDENIPQALEEWARRLGQPVLTDLRFRFTGMDESEVYPKTLTPLFLDRPLDIFGRVSDASQPVAFRIVGLSGGQERDIVFPIALDSASPGGQEIRSQWARNKLYHLIARHIETRDPSVLSEIQSLARQHGLSVPYGSDVVPLR